MLGRWSEELRSAWYRRRERLDSREEALFLRQLALMFSSGLPFTEALAILKRTSQGPASDLAEALGAALYRGYSLSRAFQNLRARMGEVVPALVEAGEASGSLVITLEIAANWAEMSADLKAKVRSALIYPIFVLVVNLILAALMLAYVLPIFVPLFHGEELPWLTRGVVGASELASSKLFWLVVLLGAGEACYFFTRPEHADKLHRFFLLMPVLGPMLRTAARARFCAILAIATRTGLPLLMGLGLAARASTDPVFIDLDKGLQRAVRDGEPLEEYFLLHRDVYGLVLSHGMAQCQATGKAEAICRHLSKLFQEDLDYRVQQFQALLEPILIAVVSLTTGGLLLSIYLPLGHFLQSLLQG